MSRLEGDRYDKFLPLASDLFTSANLLVLLNSTQHTPTLIHLSLSLSSFWVVYPTRPEKDIRIDPGLLVLPVCPTFGPSARGY